jgi:cytochrome c biogenesis protein CcmG/thiol:disulfide interchange protein DsbE
VWLTAVLVLVGLLAALFGFGLGRDPSIIRSPLVGGPAPRFDLPRLDGPGKVSLASLRGQVVVVNFWASWCPPCREEHDSLEAAWSRYRDQGLVLVGVSYQDRASSALAFRDELGGDWPLVEDPGSRTALAYGVTGPPETFVIDRDGRVALKFYGPVDYGRLTDAVSPLLRGGSS